MNSDGLHGRIYTAVCRIPRGRVATYGQIAALAGIPGHARLVGYALHGLPGDSRVPWHRVINRLGRISIASNSPAGMLQRSLLEAEGVAFDEDGTIPMKRVQWKKGAGLSCPCGTRWKSTAA